MAAPRQRSRSGRTSRVPTGQPLRSAAFHQLVADRMLEAELGAHVGGLAKVLKLDPFCYHTRHSQRSRGGFPDEVIAGTRGVLIRELKREREQPTPVQQAWLDRFAAAGYDVGVWRPSDWLSGRIEREMRAIA